MAAQPPRHAVRYWVLIGRGEVFRFDPPLHQLLQPAPPHEVIMMTRSEAMVMASSAAAAVVQRRWEKSHVVEAEAREGEEAGGVVDGELSWTEESYSDSDSSSDSSSSSSSSSSDSSTESEVEVEVEEKKE